MGNWVSFKLPEIFLSIILLLCSIDELRIILLEVEFELFVTLVVVSKIVETAKSPFKALSILSLIVSCAGSLTLEIGVLSTSYSCSEISEIYNT